MSQFFISGVQSIGLSASTSVLPMNIWDWFPLGWMGWFSLQSKQLSRVFSNITVQKHQFFGCSAFFMIQLSHQYITTGNFFFIAFMYIPGCGIGVGDCMCNFSELLKCVIWWLLHITFLLVMSVHFNNFYLFVFIIIAIPVSDNWYHWASIWFWPTT